MLNSIKSVLPPLTSTSCQGRQNPQCIATAWQSRHQSLQTVCSELLITINFCFVKLSHFSQGTLSPSRRINFDQHKIQEWKGKMQTKKEAKKTFHLRRIEALAPLAAAASLPTSNLCSTLLPSINLLHNY